MGELINCYVSFEVNDGDRELVVSVQMDIPEFAIAVGNIIEHRGICVGGVIESVSWYGGDEYDYVTELSASETIKAELLDAVCARLVDDSRVDYMELSRGGVVIKFPLAADISHGAQQTPDC